MLHADIGFQRRACAGCDRMFHVAIVRKIKYLGRTLYACPDCIENRARKFPEPAKGRGTPLAP